ncbi:hypothetical protein TRAPUB_4489 [Trametes pubescens]|uniref:Uncharacterized protein n=1 Tax=Trametes pubescens TaxID=154538 RepID=A0A1M2VAX7_TRAPU|nr:hypothetical protein TRAPUB_4489 [Trametes pubescens]
MDRTQQSNPTSFGGQHRGAEPWNDSNNFGGARDQAGGIPRGQNQDMPGDFAGTNAGNFDRTRMTADGTAPTARGPGGVFASHGGQLGTDTGVQGGDLNAGPTMGNERRAAAGRDDNFGSNAPNFRGGPGPALPGGGAGVRDNEDDMDSSGTHASSTGNPGMGNKFLGSVEKAAGRVTGNTNVAERGQIRKTGGPQADDTLL